MKEIVFLGGKEVGYQCLNFLLENSQKLGIRVKAALSNDRQVFLPDSSTVREICLRSGIPVLDSLNEYSKIDDFEILISVQYHQILKKHHIQKAKQIAVNLHMAPLPEYRGCNQFSFAIIDNAKEFGTTLHRLEEKIDGGDILFEKRFEIPGNCDVSWLYEKTLKESYLLFKENIGEIIDGNYLLTPQKQFKNIRYSSFHLRSEIDIIKEINLDWDKEKILRYFRASYFPPFSPPYAFINGEKVELTPEWVKNNIMAEAKRGN